MAALLFDDLPSFVVPMPKDELRLLASLPDYGDEECVQEIDQEDEACCRRLEKKGLVKVKRQKMDPIATFPTWFAGRLQAPIAAAPLQSNTLERDI